MSKSRTPERGWVDVRQALQQLDKRLRDAETALEETAEYVFGIHEGTFGFADLLVLSGVTLGGKGSGESRYPTLAGLV